MAESGYQDTNISASSFGYVAQPPIIPPMSPYPIFHPQWASPQWMLPPPGIAGYPASQEYPMRYGTLPRSEQVLIPNDDYMVNSLSRIYNNEDGSIEIERVKVHRLSGVYGQTDYPNMSASAPSILPSKKPPPRRKRQKRITENPDSRAEYRVQAPYMPYGFPYPYGYLPIMPPQMFSQPGLHSFDNNDAVEIEKNMGNISPEQGSDRSRKPSRKSPLEIKMNPSDSSPVPSLPKKAARVLHENPYANDPRLVNSTQLTTNSDLLYAFRKLEKNVNYFKDHLMEIAKEPKDEDQLIPASRDTEERYSETSTLVVDQDVEADNSITDTDSTEILFSSENEEEFSSDENCLYQWILVQKDDSKLIAPENLIQIREWRKQLIGALCKGQGLDDADWSTFQLLVKERRPIKDKLELVDAGKISYSNNNVGVALLRNSLLQVIKYGEMVLKSVQEREGCWMCIKADGEQPWTQVKGCLEILHVFGYRKKGRNLIYNENLKRKNEIIAELTIDILILAEEFRLYLTGIHTAPQEITKLFTEDTDIKNESAMESFCEANISSSSVPISDLAVQPVQFEETKITEVEVALAQETHEEQKASPEGSPSTDRKCSLVKIENLPETKPEEVKKVKVEDHVYEEIEEVKLKVEEIKLGIPPPLPPKSKKRLVVKKESKLSDYSDVPRPSNASIEDSKPVCSRRKKRRAPMAPNFSEKTDRNILLEKTCSREKEDQKLEEPVELPVKTKRRGQNPFYEENLKPKGFVGKNPFYEDIDSNDNKTIKPDLKSNGDNNKTKAIVSQSNDSNLCHKLSNQPNEGFPISERNSSESTNFITRVKDHDDSETIAIDPSETDAHTPGKNKSNDIVEKMYGISPVSKTSSEPTATNTNNCQSVNPEIRKESPKQPQLQASKVNEPSEEHLEKSKETHISSPPPSIDSMSNADVSPIVSDTTMAKTSTNESQERKTSPNNLTNVTETIPGETVETKPLEESIQHLPSSNSASKPPSLPPKALLRLVDEIPYIDTNLSSDDRKSPISGASLTKPEKHSPMILTTEPIACDKKEEVPPTPPPPPSISPPSSSPSPTPSLTLENSASSPTIIAEPEVAETKEEKPKPPEKTLSENQNVSDEVKRLSLHKEEWVFPNKKKDELPLDRVTRCSSADSGGYEIPENPNRIQEEMNRRRLALEKELMQQLSKTPLAPKRKKKGKTLPPRPPKPKEAPAPSLPPKGIPSSKPVTSKFKTLTGVLTKNRSPRKWSHKKFSIIQQGSQKSEGNTTPESLDMKTTRSTPPSPHLVSDRRNTLGTDKARRSWPSILCDCMDLNRATNLQ